MTFGSIVGGRIAMGVALFACPSGCANALVL
jgi:hypothetical protein